MRAVWIVFGVIGVLLGGLWTLQGLDVVKGSAVDTPYLDLKGQAMIAARFPASFAVDGAVKDTGLIAAAMREAGTDATLMDAVGQQFRKAADSGHGDDDMAAVYHAFRG